jgi:hypothetical protein
MANGRFARFRKQTEKLLTREVSGEANRVPGGCEFPVRVGRERATT